MFKKIATITIAIVLIIIGSAMLVSGQDIDVIATPDSDKITVIETYDADIISDKNISFWIQDEATGIVIFVDDVSVEYENVDDNIYFVDISLLNFTDESVIEVKYFLDYETIIFEKTLLYNVSSLSIKFNEMQIYSVNNLDSGTTFKVALQGPVQTKTVTKTKENVPTWYYAILIILIILVALSFIFPQSKAKTKKTSTKKRDSIDSEELLSTKKMVLMEVLKNIEKQHRANKISDDTYNKLKDQYKQDAVETMKQLEDVSSKVK